MHRPPPWMPDFVLDDFIKLMCVDQRKERAELLQELLKNGAGIDTLPVLTQETLIIWGDKDQVFPVELGHRLQRHLGEKIQARDRQGRRARAAAGGGRASEPLHQVFPPG
uniref:AB hydrolase-1 domain-containing protein n=1 Tax=Arundo donax TaxID=35708 RepID=A0A0A9DYR8_ARUDO